MTEHENSNDPVSTTRDLERRAGRRRSCIHLYQAQVSLPAAGKTYRATPQHISPVGFGCSVEEPIEPDTECHLTLKFTSHPPIRLTANVVRCEQVGERHFHIGVEFQEPIDDEMLTRMLSTVVG